ncbi:toxin-antitoxin system YwqK family antitoxin [Acinetobacter sp. C26M]|uniref:toxin-antitoxin system YwqK family antitoxin n=1 Tax=unclassified Acinetobacter TaxID=196816 RepID=UPI0014200B7B|nr:MULTISPECIES: toxin-antitoxin system YwqK family antitoxin [unclassified Acinetobacter]NIE96389.1 toxin-antitoxin system YwqK family antitoxin [Acinetobacter sp. Tr-809]USA46674.1 toxin-antitoxin system YwqK family antitoxin [Acinetobacter sp. C26M]USA50158.1 toxin-antitoxin system YwqK family antitoxin [Acinetobacter sp. C26G]
MKFSTICFFTSLFFLSACSQSETQNQHLNEKTEQKLETHDQSTDSVILYMKNAESSGQEATTKEQAEFYRVLLKKLDGQKILVQDFYISGKKQTDPYILTDGKLDYVYNEQADTSYYPREGSRVVWYESGSKAAETEYNDHKENGLWRVWYENGNLKEETNYKAGKINGISKNWNEDGKLTGECNYKDGLEDGRCYEKYTMNPQVFIYDGTYKKGMKVGEWKEWDEEGKLVKVENHDD